MTNPTDIATRALATYDTLVSVDETSVIAWRNIAIRLWATSHDLTGDRQTFVRDRANDAHARADRARRAAGAGLLPRHALTCGR